MPHEGLGDFVEYLRFGLVGKCFQIFRAGCGSGLVNVEAGQQALNVDQWLWPLARVEFGVGG